jgi:hypothetical protein
MDTNSYDLEPLVHIPKKNRISLAHVYPLSLCLNKVPHAREWFPDNVSIFLKTLSEGAGQVRAVARLLYEVALDEHRFDWLLGEAGRLAEVCERNGCRMRISVMTTLTGGTGAGLFIQVALLLREYISRHFPELNVKIHGEFILPAALQSMLHLHPAESRNMECNAYAALKELNAINEHFFSNTAPVELRYGYWQNDGGKYFVDMLPYDYCFLYDRMAQGQNFVGTDIENAIIERLFSGSANGLNAAFVDALRRNDRKRAGNLYGTVYTEKLPSNASVDDSAILRKAGHSPSAGNEKRIFFVRSPHAANVDTALISRDTVFAVKIHPDAQETTVTELCFGMELAQLEHFRFGKGQYYASYRTVTDRLPMVTTPHLDKNWHAALSDIGIGANSIRKASDVAPQPVSMCRISRDNFVFISYSSQESVIANRVKELLETNGVPCWMAPQSIPAGSDYGVEIPRAIGKCRALLLLLSDASQKSNWVPKEVGLAIGKGKIVIPFQIDNAPIGDAFNFYLTNSQRISAHNRMAEANRELLSRLNEILT